MRILARRIVARAEGHRLNLRILFVDDSPDDVDLMLGRLRVAGIEAQWERVQTEAAFREALTAEPWQLALVDYSLPGFGGLEALGLLAELAPDVPAVTVSGAISEETAVATIAAGVVDFEVDRVGSDGRRRIIAVTANYLEGADCLVSYGRDITDKRLAEGRAAESEALYRRIVETAGEGIVAIDAEQRIAFVNPQMAALLGYETDKILGRLFSGFLLPRTSPATLPR
jgi:PAS domain-containing protein